MIKRGALKYQHYGEGIPEVVFDLARDPGERENVAGDAAYGADLQDFRRRLAELGYGPDAKSGYVNAGYRPGMPVAESGTGTLWEPDSNPWLDS
jgi:hypothetical protein